MTPDAFRARIAPLLPASLEINRAVQVRAPGDSPYLRAGDAVLPPVVVKTMFGEFAARPGRRPGTLRIDPAWTAAHIETAHVPLLGQVTCNRQILPQLTAAMRRVERRAPSNVVRSYDGCYVPRFIGWSDENMLSYHSWGIAFDVNAGANVRGETPDQDPRLVRILARYGFEWGGSWIVPDGNHFEFHRGVPLGG
jgi:D-alanyl-D-alanine carboxypeptidase-like protein